MSHLFLFGPRGRRCAVLGYMHREAPLDLDPSLYPYYKPLMIKFRLKEKGTNRGAHKWKGTGFKWDHYSKLCHVQPQESWLWMEHTRKRPSRWTTEKTTCTLAIWPHVAGEPSRAGWALQVVRKLPHSLASLGTRGATSAWNHVKGANYSSPWKTSSPCFSRQQGSGALSECAGLPTPVSQSMMLERRKGAERGVKPGSINRKNKGK